MAFRAALRFSRGQAASSQAAARASRARACKSFMGIPPNHSRVAFPRPYYTKKTTDCNAMEDVL